VLSIVSDQESNIKISYCLKYISADSPNSAHSVNFEMEIKVMCTHLYYMLRIEKIKSALRTEICSILRACDWEAILNEVQGVPK